MQNLLGSPGVTIKITPLREDTQKGIISVLAFEVLIQFFAFIRFISSLRSLISSFVQNNQIKTEQICSVEVKLNEICRYTDDFMK